MEKSFIEQALKNMAKKENVSIDFVKNELEIVIDMGFNNIDPKIRKYWKSIPCKGNKPSIQEVTYFLLEELIKGNNL